MKKIISFTTAEIFEKLLSEQNNVCAICLLPESSKRKGKVKRLSIDHCHDSNRIRGLLCRNCNLAIGFFEDDLSRIERAIKYLSRDFSNAPSVREPPKFLSEEWKKEISQRMIGNTRTLGNVLTDEQKRKISESNKGKKRTPEQRARMSVAALNRKKS